MTRRLTLPANDLMVQFAHHHRDRRNIGTHMVGVPMIVFGLGVLLARGHLALGSSSMSLAWAAWTLATLWYLSRGHLLLGLSVSLFTALLFALAHLPAAGTAAQWLTWGLGFLLAGALLQRVGHCYEGKKLAGGADPSGLLVGPMFVSAELLFALGLARPLQAEVERRAGPTVLRDLAHPVG